MAERLFTKSVHVVDPGLTDARLASPSRRLASIIIDGLIVLPPTLLLAVAVAAVSLSINDPVAYDGLHSLFTTSDGTEARAVALENLAPALVEIDAPGLPSSIHDAVEENDLQLAGELLGKESLVISLSFSGDSSKMKTGSVLLPIDRFIPTGVRFLALFGVAAFYFTYLASLGMLGAGLFDLWREPNRRLTHDRVVNTVVIRSD
jgi:hypothetical protein